MNFFYILNLLESQIKQHRLKQIIVRKLLFWIIRHTQWNIAGYYLFSVGISSVMCKSTSPCKTWIVPHTDKTWINVNIIVTIFENSKETFNENLMIFSIIFSACGNNENYERKQCLDFKTIQSIT